VYCACKQEKLKTTYKILGVKWDLLTSPYSWLVPTKSAWRLTKWDSLSSRTSPSCCLHCQPQSQVSKLSLSLSAFGRLSFPFPSPLPANPRFFTLCCCLLLSDNNSTPPCSYFLNCFNYQNYYLLYLFPFQDNVKYI